MSMAEGQDSVVWTALEMFTGDYRTVFGGEVAMAEAQKAQVVVKTDSAMSERTQAFRLEVNNRGLLFITGSDKRGTAYGLLELSRLIGVSPWEWWADVMPEPREVFTLPAGYTSEQSPSVEYRGIFINDVISFMRVLADRRQVKFISCISSFASRPCAEQGPKCLRHVFSPLGTTSISAGFCSHSPPFPNRAYSRS